MIQDEAKQERHKNETQCFYFPEATNLISQSVDKVMLYVPVERSKMSIYMLNYTFTLTSVMISENVLKSQTE